MAGPLKRTKLKSSPEEAALYRRHHDRGVAALRSGGTRDALLKELADQGVSLLSAERLVTAFEQEASLHAAAHQSRRGNGSTYLIIMLLSAAGIGAIILWAWYRD
jgi:hypothetical protein